MSFVKDRFFGGAEKKAGQEIQRIAERGRGDIQGAQATIRGEQANILGGRQFIQAGDVQLAGAQQGVGQQLGATVGGLQPFADTGLSAFQRQQSLSGALGQEAQAQAFSTFEESPGVAFLREQGLRQAGAAQGAGGQLGSGERLRELSRFGQGLALQSLVAQQQQLSEGAGRGLAAAQNIGQFRAQAAGTTAGLAGQRAQLGIEQARLGTQAAELGAQGAGLAVEGAQIGNIGAEGRAQGLIGQAAGTRAGVGGIAKLAGDFI